MHSKLIKAETSNLFSDDSFINYGDTSNIVVKSVEDGKTRFYCRRPDGYTYNKKVELASKPKYKWCSNRYGNKNIEICQAKAIGIGRLVSAAHGGGHGSYCWADIEVKYDESEDLYTITYIPHQTIISRVYAERSISGVLCFQFRDFGQPTGTSHSRSSRRHGTSHYNFSTRSYGRLYHSNFRFLSPYYYEDSSFQGAQIVIPDIRYRYETEVDGRDMRNLFVCTTGIGRNIAYFNKAQIDKDAQESGQIHTPLIGVLNTCQFDPNDPDYDVKPYNNDINKFSGHSGTRNSVRNNKHRLEIKCRYVLCTNPSDYTSMNGAFVRRCNSQIFTGVISLGGAGKIYED